MTASYLKFPRSATHEDAALILRRLGYVTNISEVDVATLAGIGITPPAGLRSLVHLATRENCFFYYAETDDRTAGRDITSRLDAINSVARAVVIARSPASVDLFSRSANAHRRIPLTDADPAEISRSLELLSPGPDRSIDQTIEKLFDPSETGRRFFTRFRDGVSVLRQHLVSSVDDAEADLLDDVPLLLLSRVLFLSFIEEKGWLDGNRSYLSERSRDVAAAGGEIFRDFFVPLFFGCLNTPPNRRFVSARRLGRLPYLNGGLFEPSEWERARGPFHLPNEIWSEVLEKVFQGVRFIASEEDGAVHEVDPEMLGKVFESLMMSDERLRSGSFYTPRHVVDRIVRHAFFARFPELQMMREGNAFSRSAPSVVNPLLRRLDDVRVLDPACGSGAFLLGALRFLENAHLELSRTVEVAPDPFVRRRIVERNLFGVDVKREAVRLCELRLWLAIVANLDCAVEEIPPLPNLDRNVMQGNSLLEPLDIAAGRSRAAYRSWSAALRKQSDTIERYRNASSEERSTLLPAIIESDRRIADAILHEELARLESERRNLTEESAKLFRDITRCPDLREIDADITEHRKQIARVSSGELDFFSYDVHFASVIRDGGFDVVVSNPPWVRRHRIEPALRTRLDQRYRTFGSTGFDQTDLSVAFVERAFALTRTDGVVSMLVPAKLSTARYATALRKLITEEHSLRQLDDFSASARKMFDADTFPLGLTVQRRTGASADLVEITREDQRHEVVPEHLRIGSSGGARWFLGDASVSRIVRDVTRRLPAFREALHREPLMGVKTGANDRFFLRDLQLRKNHALLTGTTIRIPYVNLVRAVRGRDVDEFVAGDGCWMLLPPKKEALREAPGWLIRLAELFGTTASAMQLSYLRAEHLGLKVVWKDLSRGMRAAVVPESVVVGGRNVPVVPNQTLYFVDCGDEGEAHALAAYLNSRIVRALALVGAEPAKDDHQRYYASHVALLPCPEVVTNDERWRELAAIGRKAARALDRDRLDDVVRDLLRISVREAAKLRAYQRSVLGA